MTDQPLTVTKMQALLQQMAADADHRAIFLNCYLLMTQNMLTAIDAGEFHDGVWVRTLLNQFADYYFNGLAQYNELPANAPTVWCVVHSAAERHSTLVAQNLLLGINTHVNNDLVFVLVDILEPEWDHLSPVIQRQRYQDYCHVNDIIGATIDEVQDSVVEKYSPMMEILDRMMGRVDEWLVSRLITHWRDEVWGHVVALLTTSDTAERQKLRARVEEIALQRASGILLNQS